MHYDNDCYSNNTTIIETFSYWYIKDTYSKRLTKRTITDRLYNDITYLTFTSEIYTYYSAVLCILRCGSRKYERLSAIHFIRGRAVFIATGYGLDDRGVGVAIPEGSRIFTYPYRPDRLWGPTGPLSNGVKRPGREADNSPQTSAEIKKTWIYKSFRSPIRLHGLVLR
jgi:hypothetical protein